MEPIRIYGIAGEASGDRLGAALMEAFAREVPGAKWEGVGGPRMEAHGLKSLFPMREISLIGFAEVLPHVLRLKRRIRETVAHIERVRPDAVVTIDSPGFTFRVVEALRQRGRARPAFIHYVAPTVWAYKPGRAGKTAALFDHLLCLLPFEPPWFMREGLAATFVGHPAAEDIPRCPPSVAREKLGIAEDAVVLCLLPGSREGELRRHLPAYAETVEALRDTLPRPLPPAGGKPGGVALLMPVPPAVAPLAREMTASWRIPPRVLESDAEKALALAASDVALAKSGTVSLDVAASELPMVTTYRVHPLSAWLLRRMLGETRTPALPLREGRRTEGEPGGVLKSAFIPPTQPPLALPASRGGKRKVGLPLTRLGEAVAASLRRSREGGVGRSGALNRPTASTRLQYVNLINILLGREAVPERLQERCSAADLAPELATLLADPAAREAQLAAFREALAMLRPPGGSSPAELAANTLKRIISQKLHIPGEQNGVG